MHKYTYLSLIVSIWPVGFQQQVLDCLLSNGETLYFIRQADVYEIEFARKIYYEYFLCGGLKVLIDC